MLASASSFLCRPVQKFYAGGGGRKVCYGDVSKNICVRAKKQGDGFFLDNSHLKYYSNGLSMRCDGKKKEYATGMKKKLKLLKGLSNNLCMVSEMGLLDFCDGGSVDPSTKTFSEVTQVLLTKMQQLKAEKKELKRKKKEEKKKLKAMKIKSTKRNCESSSSSSQSSDIQSEDVMDINRLRSSNVSQLTRDSSLETAPAVSLLTSPRTRMCEEMDNMLSQICTNTAAARVNELHQVSVQEDVTLTNSSLPAEEYDKLEEIDDHSLMSSKEECCTRGRSRTESSSAEKNSSAVESFAERIDVCMGGKCKKFGAAALLKELERKIGVEGAVVRCKCMGKCKTAPNVRVSSKRNKGQDDSVTITKNPLFLGVGLEDVDTIVANFVGEEKKSVDSVC
ncbi:hypothetical protein IFM89_018625 [Coptis chinensis]|uniref:Uncharacterized protein n=1 Tax=Coptis chinensis TaxID=261450 RepID=A0A835H6C7_9MAGN|nr:hypothetical protein IFM89_018625 [Coptis chinensis]